MSVLIRHGNMFECDDVIPTITCNCVGIMGKGIALEAKKRMPLMFEDYRKGVKEGLIHPGKPRMMPRHNVLLFPTKAHWRNPSKIEWVEEGLHRLAKGHHLLKMPLAIPPLGCGLGGLKWYDVFELILQYLDPVPHQFFVFPPSND